MKEESFIEKVHYYIELLWIFTEIFCFLCPIACQSEMVSAFDQSLSTMTNRLHQMTLSCEQKDREINSLKETIEQLRREKENNSAESGRGKRTSSLPFTSPSSSSGSKNGSLDQLNGKKVRMRSCSRDRDSVSINSGVTTADSSTSGWIRQSISRAFRKNRARSKSGNESGSDVDSVGSRSNLSSLTDVNGSNSATSSVPMSDSTSSKMLTKETEDTQNVTELKETLKEKERAMTDLRLESLSLAHQMEGMKESMAQMKDQMDDLRAENRKLQLLLTSSQSADKSIFAKNSSSFSISSPLTCDQINSQNSTDPLVSILFCDKKQLFHLPSSLTHKFYIRFSIYFRWLL